MPFHNFSIWRGKLPHWRADDVRYFVTFRYRRPLQADERRLLLRNLLKPDGHRYDIEIVTVGEEHAELIFCVRSAMDGRPYELSEIVEKAKTRAGKAILKSSGERFPPFYGESYDRIIRDQAELEERWQAIFDLGTQDEDADFLWFAELPDIPSD